MRIGYLTYGLDRAPTGIGRYATELLRAFERLAPAHELVLLTTEQTDPHGFWQRFERHPLPGCRLLPALMTVGNLWLSRAAQRYGLDVIHDPNGIAPFLGPRGGARRIVTIHDTFAYVYPEAHNRLDNWRYRTLLPRAARNADLVLTDSNHSRRDLQRFLNLPSERITAIPCAVNQQFRPANVATRQAVLARYGITNRYLLYIGSINGRKNIARLFEAYALVRQRYPELKLVIGGKRQWQTAELDAVFTQLELEDSVRFTGYLDDADLPALYSGCAAFVFPSLYEGFGLPPLEAMACGAPVICSNSSSLPEVVGDAALTVDPYDVAGLAAAIERVLADSDLRTDLQRRGRIQAAHFSWERTASATLASYQQVLALDPAAPLRHASLNERHQRHPERRERS